MMGVDEMRMCRPQIARDFVDRVATDNNPGWNVENRVLRPEFVNRGTSALRIAFAKNLLKIAPEQFANTICRFNRLSHRLSPERHSSKVTYN